jgi:SAM-dependent methyltransferase
VERRGFEFNGHHYDYFCHMYHRTWRNERAVEIPIAKKIVKSCKGRILEVGNVLNHYLNLPHEVVDKYEPARGVINSDIVDFQRGNPSPPRYDLIISISTLEHVGWDEQPRESTKILRAIERMRNLLRPDGLIFVTLPVGFNPHVDSFIDQGRIGFREMYCLKKSNRTWRQTSWMEVRATEYGPSGANAIVLGYL